MSILHALPIAFLIVCAALSVSATVGLLLGSAIRLRDQSGLDFTRVYSDLEHARLERERRAREVRR